MCMVLNSLGYINRESSNNIHLIINRNPKKGSGIEVGSTLAGTGVTGKISD